VVCKGTTSIRALDRDIRWTVWALEVLIDRGIIPAFVMMITIVVTV
jgi:hypothetical protein